MSQRLTQQRPVVGIVIAQKRLVQPPHPEALGDAHTGAGACDPLQRILAGVIHRRGARHRRGQKGLHLIGAKTVALEPERELEHVFVGRARMRGDEIGNQILLFANLFRVFIEQFLEAVIGADPGLHHFRERPVAHVLGRNLQVAADVMLHQFLDVFG